MFGNTMLTGNDEIYIECGRMLQYLSKVDIDDCRKHKIPFFLSLSNLSSPGKIYNIKSGPYFLSSHSFR